MVSTAVLPPIAASVIATIVVGNCTIGMPRNNVAATNPAMSPTTPPPSATIAEPRSRPCAISASHKRLIRRERLVRFARWDLERDRRIDRGLERRDPVRRDVLIGDHGELRDVAEPARDHRADRTSRRRRPDSCARRARRRCVASPARGSPCSRRIAHQCRDLRDGAAVRIDDRMRAAIDRCALRGERGDLADRLCEQRPARADRRHAAERVVDVDRERDHAARARACARGCGRSAAAPPPVAITGPSTVPPRSRSRARALRGVRNSASSRATSVATGSPSIAITSSRSTKRRPVSLRERAADRRLAGRHEPDQEQRRSHRRLLAR